ncbi:MAG: homoserine dehydrogenase [Armatimonadetes bacterium]|nr:homoserine dehydrogenase [Armatimonadota bacterium]
MKIGLLGLGTVGSGVVDMLTANADIISARGGTTIEITRCLVQDMQKARPAHAPSITKRAEDILADPDIEVVVEVMGGVEPAWTYIARALDSGKHVVTANKELMARHGRELLKSAEDKGLDLLFEAAVCAGIPVIQSLKNQLSGNRVRSIMGIVNGTTNYILTRMHADRAEYNEVLAEAQEKGFAEADPTADVENFDAQSKLAILCGLAFACAVRPEDIYRQGIGHIETTDIEYAELLGYRVKSVAIGRQEDGKIEARVHPAMVSLANPLSKVDGPNNAVLLQGDFVGDLMLFGSGAGKDATASAVVGDLIEIARNRHSGAHGRIGSTNFEEKPIQDVSDSLNRYYLRVTSEDRPRALGQIALAFGDNDVSLSALEMHELPESRSELVFLTHQACEANFMATLDAIRELPMIEKLDNWIRVVS